MAPVDLCLASMARLSLSQAARPSISSVPRFLAPTVTQTRQASVVHKSKTKAKKKRTVPKDFRRHNLAKRDFPTYSLCEAMRVLRAVEVGHPPTSVKYEVAVNLKTMRSGPVVKASLRLPFPVQNDERIAVICPEDSDISKAALNAGAVVVGEESIFEMIRSETFDFDRLLCHESSEAALNKANLGKILGPKGLMPNRRMKTIIKDVTGAVRDSAGAADIRERQGVIRLAVGQLRHTPEQVKTNIQTILKKIKADCQEISEESPKEINDVVLSTTHGPALVLSGKLRHDEDHIAPEALRSIM